MNTALVVDEGFTLHGSVLNDGGKALLVLHAEQLELQLVLDAQKEVIEVAVSFVHFREVLVGGGGQYRNCFQGFLLELQVGFIEGFDCVLVVMEVDGKHVLSCRAAHDAYERQAETIQVELLEHLVIIFAWDLSVK